MKCDTVQSWILLEDSGELSDRQADALVAHIDSCPNCRALQQILTEVRTAVHPEAEPSEVVLNDIKREARKLAPESKSLKRLYFKPVLAIAASGVILLGILIAPMFRDRVGLELIMSDTELLGTRDQIVSVMYEGLSEDDLAFNFLMTYNEDI